MRSLIERISSSELATNNPPPAIASSNSGAAILIPAAATTSLTGENLSRGSRISSSGLGIRRARTCVIIGSGSPPTTMVSP